MTDKIDRMKQRAEALKARAAAAEARARKAEKSADLRRKILAGSWLLSRFGRDLGGLGPEQLADFRAYLTRDLDRAVFGLSGKEVE